MSLIVLPLALVLGTILPDLDSETVAHAPRAIVHFIAIDRVHSCASWVANYRWRLHHVIGLALFSGRSIITFIIGDECV